ncbi:hypothetical protein COP2_005734 [Malus domestica]
MLRFWIWKHNCLSSDPYSANKLIIILPTFFFSAVRTTAAATQRLAATFFLLYKRLRYPLLQTTATVRFEVVLLLCWFTSA